MTEAEKRMREIYAQELDRDGEGMAAFLWRESEPAHPDSSNGRIIRAMLAAEAAAIERLGEALAPFTKEIDRLERDYGFDRPLHQGQTLMLPLSDLLNLRAALKEGASHVG